mmetsp:Transcript_45060/g.107421  ORF Transcript_45060/g.107421 Transcript_45060/m.107421 type:complete len:202 (-) Transcript_45060:2031-2636(-)
MWACFSGARARASRTARAPLASFMLERQTSATSSRPVLTHMCAMLSHTDAPLMSLTARYASSMLPIVRLNENSSSALRVSSEIRSIPTKSRMVRADIAASPSREFPATVRKSDGTDSPKSDAWSGRPNRSWRRAPFSAVANSVITSRRCTLVWRSFSELGASEIRCTSTARRRGSVVSHMWLNGKCSFPQSTDAKLSASKS